MNYKTICLLVAVLLLSQWFSLVHATDHFLVGGEPNCHICQLNSGHGQATVVDYAQDLIPAIFIYDLSLYEIQYHSFNCYVITIRGPPENTPVI